MELNKESMARLLTILAKVALVILLGYLVIGNPMSVVAQNYDYGSVEAYINDHKQQRSLLLARATLEYGNKMLHEESAGSAMDYKDVNTELDKYTRAFEIIDIIYQSARAAINVYHTYDDVRETITGYASMLESFDERVIQRGRIETADTLLISINRKAIQNIANEGEYLYKSVYDLTLYCTGAAACTTSDILVLMENINDSLDRLRMMIKTAYFETWKYVQLRIGFWKGRVYRSRPLRSILDDAFGRWKQVGQDIIYRNMD